MTAGGIMLANYLPHDEVLQSLGLWREEFGELLGRELFSLYTIYYICHAVAMLDT